VAIIGLLAGVALPQYLNARAAADGGAKIGESVGLAKECAVFIASGGVGVLPAARTGDPTCVTTGNTIYTRSWGGTVGGLTCLGNTRAASSKSTITVATDGTMTCALS